MGITQKEMRGLNDMIMLWKQEELYLMKGDR